MENPELKHYIDEQLKGGTPPEELKKLLVHHGWDASIVDAHLPTRVPTPSFQSSGLIDPTPSAADQSGVYTGSRAKRIWGVIMISLPAVLIATAVSGFAVSQLVIARMSGASATLGAGTAAGAIGLGAADQRQVIAQIMGVAMGLIGVIGVISIFIFIPIGLILLAKARGDLKPGVAYDERSGKGEASVVPPEIKGWNWGAAFLGFYWGIYYRVWIIFVMFVPIVGGIWWIVMGIMGNQWAWQHNKWLSVEDFKRSQKKWVPWAIVTLILQIVFVALYFALFASVLFGLFNTKNSALLPNNGGLQNMVLNTNLPSVNVGKAGKVVSVTADGKLFNITAADGKEYTVDIGDASFYNLGGSGKTVVVGDNVMVTGAESSGIIKALGVVDYGTANGATLNE